MWEGRERGEAQTCSSEERMFAYIYLKLDADRGFTLKDIHSICVHANKKYEELKGIRPLQRMEVGFGLPEFPEEEDETFWKVVVKVVKKGGKGSAPCIWNMWIPDNWQKDLPSHKFFNTKLCKRASVTKRLAVVASSFEEDASTAEEKKEEWVDYIGRMEQSCKSFAYFPLGQLHVAKDGCTMKLQLVCDMPKKKIEAFRECLKELDYL